MPLQSMFGSDMKVGERPPLEAIALSPLTNLSFGRERNVLPLSREGVSPAPEGSDVGGLLNLGVGVRVGLERGVEVSVGGSTAIVGGVAVCLPKASGVSSGSNMGLFPNPPKPLPLARVADLAPIYFGGFSRFGFGNRPVSAAICPSRKFACFWSAAIC